MRPPWGTQTTRAHHRRITPKCSTGSPPARPAVRLRCRRHTTVTGGMPHEHRYQRGRIHSPRGLSLRFGVSILVSLRRCAGAGLRASLRAGFKWLSELSDGDVRELQKKGGKILVLSPENNAKLGRCRKTQNPIRKIPGTARTASKSCMSDTEFKCLQGGQRARFFVPEGSKELTVYNHTDHQCCDKIPRGNLRVQ